MALRRGFKSEANAIATEVRAELGLTVLAPLDPHDLAAHLDIPVHPLSSFAAIAPKSVQLFSGSEQSVFSAVTVFRGHRREIVHNDSHSLGRQHSNIAHELAHGLLLHEPQPAFDDRGCRYWDEDAEDEANFLGAALLLTAEAALMIARRGISAEDACRQFCISKQMLRYRLNITGATVRVQREHARRRARSGR